MLPNFFIVGAPKCGTNSMYEWLKDNKEIYMSDIKEPHYFSTDLNNRSIKDKKEYERIFEAVKKRHVAVGEASVFYMYSEVAIENIEKTIDDARYVVMLRNPYEIAVSLHQQQIVSGNEHIEDFEKAWSLSEDRAKGKKTKIWTREPKLLDYKSVCSIGSQLERLHRKVQNERIKVVFIDEIKNNPLLSYKEVVKFLGAKYQGKKEFEKVNTAKERYFKSVRKVVDLINMIKRKMNVSYLNTGIIDKIDKANMKEKETSRKNIKKTIKRNKKIDEEITKIEKITDETLKNWRI